MDEDVVVDACCLINLCAAQDDLEKWLPSLGGRWHVPTAVLAETMYLRTEDDSGTEQRPVDLQHLVDADVLATCRVKGAVETQLYVDLAVELDDGEAMAIAIARNRGWLLSTDDRKANRLAAERGLRVLTTAEIVKRWSEVVSPSDQAIREMLQRIEKRARFFPPTSDPYHEWWRKSIGD